MLLDSGNRAGTVTGGDDDWEAGASLELYVVSAGTFVFDAFVGGDGAGARPYVVLLAAAVEVEACRVLYPSHLFMLSSYCTLLRDPSCHI